MYLVNKNASIFVDSSRKYQDNICLYAFAFAYPSPSTLWDDPFLSLRADIICWYPLGACVFYWCPLEASDIYIFFLFESEEFFILIDTLKTIWHDYFLQLSRIHVQFTHASRLVLSLEASTNVYVRTMMSIVKRVSALC